MPTKEELRALVRDRQDAAISRLNEVLAGVRVADLEAVLQRVGRGGALPHWYEQLRDEHTLPNLDGKTIGSVIEMLFLAVLETETLADAGCPPLRVSPARGVDLPDLDLNLKSPSKNYNTSEPFFSAYERLNGSEYELLVLITDYQEKKKTPPLVLRVTQWRYLEKTEVADRNLCAIALKHREWMTSEGEAHAHRLFKFLAYVNQSDWRARRLVALIDDLPDEDAVRARLRDVERDFESVNEKRLQRGIEPLLDHELIALTAIEQIQPLWLGNLTAADNWVTETHKDFARVSNDNEWNRLRNGPLNGIIGMSYALQWRYNFRSVFREVDEPDDEEVEGIEEEDEPEA